MQRINVLEVEVGTPVTLVVAVAGEPEKRLPARVSQRMRRVGVRVEDDDGGVWRVTPTNTTFWLEERADG